MAIRADVQPDIRFSRTLAGGGGKSYLGDFRAVHGLPVVQYMLGGPSPDPPITR